MSVIEGTKLGSGEVYWRDHQPWLEKCGYMLRARYRPGWEDAHRETKEIPAYHAEGPPLIANPVMDATRTSDGKMVMLKRVKRSEHPFEAEIGQFFNTQPQASDPRNHCVPILEVLQDPDDEDSSVLVMPFLRSYYEPEFDTYGEAVECFRQLFEGLKFMHDHHVAHRDCGGNNVMMDASDMYPDGFHPVWQDRSRDFKGKVKHYTRTQKPPKYYFVDFGLSRRYDPANGPPLERPIVGGDKSVPEFQGVKEFERSDPFPTDVYYIGNLIREDIFQGYFELHQPKLGFEFVAPLVADMCQDDPAKRPTMSEVVTRFDEIVQGLSTWKLRSRVVSVGEFAIASFFRDIPHWVRRLRYIASRVPALSPNALSPNVTNVAEPPAPTTSTP